MQMKAVKPVDLTLDFEDSFDKGELDLAKWLPYYLPQWSSRKNSKANYRFENNQLILQITEDQQPWCPEFNGAVKVSSLQTAVYSGKLGSVQGQHKFNKNCVVREEQLSEKNYLPRYGFFEIRAKALNTASNVVALWMIGYEEKPEESAEICIFEVKGENVKKDSAIIGYGIHKFNDPALEETFFEEEFAIDVTEFHTYAVNWMPGKVEFFVDNQLVRSIGQAPDYPMQLMLNIYEVPVEVEKTSADRTYPKEFVVDYVKVYR